VKNQCVVLFFATLILALLVSQYYVPI